MKEKRVSYYLIRNRILAKRENDGKYDSDYLFRDGKWVKDFRHVIMNHLMGFDSSEPEDSPYRYGNTDILMEIDKISEEHAIPIMNQQILDFLKNKWKEEFAPKKEEWDKKPRWPAKLVKIKFSLHGVKYSLSPVDMGLMDDCWDQGFMEMIQPDISEDLEECGATDIYNIGFID